MTAPNFLAAGYLYGVFNIGLMTILYFVDSFPVTSETFVINEVDEMSRQGEDISIVSLNTPAVEAPHTLGILWKNKTIYLDKIEYFFIKNLLAMLTLAALNPIRFIRAVLKARDFDKSVQWKFRRSFWLANYSRKMGAQHIHAHFACEAAEMAWIVNWLTGIPFSVSTHGYDIYVNPYRFIGALSSDASFVRSVCKFNIHALQDLGVSQNKISVIHCGIRTEQFSSSDNIEKDIDIICVARLHPVKGIPFLIDAVAEIVKKKPMVRLCIVGDGPERGALENGVAMHNLSRNVEFHGFCSQDEIRELLSRSKVFCLPSLGDSVGVATMEAMAMGVPVISTTVKGIPELVNHEKTGLLVPPSDVESLTSALLRLLDDANYRHMLSVSAKRSIVQNFNQTIEVGKLRNMIRTK